MSGRAALFCAYALFIALLLGYAYFLWRRGKKG